ncbi:MAG TPA: TonB-dependent receptor plug domain-containing protein, partial [Burkholderiaceae bacterium]|nr:TonB-dependent receptor plug domain-containing protein [Burkholderiaceae bacterium]
MDNILTSFIGASSAVHKPEQDALVRLGLSINLSTPSGGNPMFQRTKICTGLLMAFGTGLLAAAPGAFAQDSSVQRVEITGSSIKRVDAETSVPVTVIKADDLKKAGLTSVEQVLQQVSSVQVQQTSSQAVGAGTGGGSYADMRGLGYNKTLVLLNGRRIANSAFTASAPDINTIPFAAIERVEVLRDGASALYGTDAI